MLIYEICLLMIKYKILIYVEWISSQINFLADNLSRKAINEFKSNCKALNIAIKPKMNNFIYFQDFKFMNDKNSIENTKEYTKFCKWIKLNPQNRQPYYQYIKNNTS